MLISHRNRFIFLKTVKTGGTSVEMFLEPYCAGPGHVVAPAAPETVTEHGIIGARRSAPLRSAWFNHMSATQIRRGVGEAVWNGYQKITCVRNPFDKVVSWFHFSVKRDLRKIAAYSDFDDVELFRRWLSGPTPHLPIDRQVYTIDGEVAADHVLRFESLTSDLENVVRMLELDGADLSRLGREKSSLRPDGDDWRRYYDPQGASVVRLVYGFEFRRFGYSVD